MRRILQIGMSDTLGGIEVFIMNLYRRIDKDQFQFDFIKFSDSIPFEEEIKNLGGKIYRVKNRNESFLQNRRELKNLLIEHPEYSEIHYHINSCSYIYPAVVASNLGRRVIIHSHNSGLKSKLLTRALHTVNQRNIEKYTDTLLSCSNEASIFMFPRKHSETIVIPNAIDAEKFKFSIKTRQIIRDKYNLGDSVVLGTIGRLTEQKNHLFMIDVLAEIVKIIPDVKLLIGGEGPLKDSIVDKVNSLDLESNVVFLGLVTEPNKFLCAMDLFLMPSFYEGLSISAIEAQASGLPVLVSEFVPTGTYIKELIFEMSLTDTAQKWAEKIVDIHLPDRAYYWEEFLASEYNISNSVSLMESIYEGN